MAAVKSTPLMPTIRLICRVWRNLSCKNGQYHTIALHRPQSMERALLKMTRVVTALSFRAAALRAVTAVIYWAVMFFFLKCIYQKSFEKICVNKAFTVNNASVPLLKINESVSCFYILLNTFFINNIRQRLSLLCFC